MFLSNKYTNWYFRIVTHRLLNPYDGKGEKHHIIPKSCGGHPKCFTNIVHLSHREHFVCHLLLTRMFPGGEYKNKMNYALFTMARMGKHKTSSRQYEYARRLHQKTVSAAKKGKPCPWNQITNRDPDKIRKMAETHRGMKRSKEAKSNMSRAAMGLRRGQGNGLFKGWYVTPSGEFESASLAAQALGLHVNTVYCRCKRYNVEGWGFRHAR
jgi:hypothetical protein